MKTFYNLSSSRLFWFAGAISLLVMESIALYFQYELGYEPCALCVQIRAWVMGAIILTICTSFVCTKFLWRWIGLTLTSAMLIGGLKTSWYSMGVENGDIIGSCSSGAGFPSFMPLDDWMPWLFSAQGLCGQSPNMWFGLSMNEGLIITLAIPVIVLLAQWLLHCREFILNFHSK